MKKHAHWWATVLFALALAYDLAFWGAAARQPDIGAKLRDSAQRQALLAHVYMNAGSALDAAVPMLDDWGARHVRTAFAEGFQRIENEPLVSMDLIFSNTWNSTHATMKVMYWAAPVLGLLALILWSRRPRKIRLMGRR
jgi:hypothetical protein